MKKILFTCDGEHFYRSAFKMAASLNNQEKIFLKGIFVPSIDYSIMVSLASADSYEGMMPPELFDQEEKAMDKSIAEFETLCKENGVSYDLYKHTGFESLQVLLDEARFSDLILLGSDHFISVLDRTLPNMEMNQLLHDTECPVLLVPPNFVEPECIVFAYDGGASCMAAAKQFGALMASYTKLPFKAVFFSSSSEGKAPYEAMVIEYLSCHYKDFKLNVSDRISGKNLEKWMAAYNNPLIVTGSYSRGGLSRVFKRSFISDAITNHQNPIFLFHVKEK
ncbi:MAG TPA: universal stress protein [Candidatus Babeliaceae bacterium]|nr:universal stress protein [Candidatus Babeliaceae bacterium]